MDSLDQEEKAQLEANHRRLRAMAAPPTIHQPGRNEPCPCGSGRKYKKCCGASWATPYQSATLSHSYDEQADILEIEGIRYAGVIFRSLGVFFPIGALFRLLKREDGVITVEQLPQKEKVS